MPTFQSLLKGSSGKRNNNKNNSNDDDNNIKNDAGKVMIEDVSFVRAQVEGIDTKNQQVVISHCISSSSNSNNDNIETIRYEALVIARGSEISLGAGMEYALPFWHCWMVIWRRGDVSRDLLLAKLVAVAVAVAVVAVVVRMLGTRIWTKLKRSK